MLEGIFFYAFAALTLAAALLVVLSRQPIYSVLSLFIAIFCLAALFVMLGAYFVAVLQILLYAGAVLVLFLFVIMLLNLQQAALAYMRPFTLRALGVSVAVLFCAELVWLIARPETASSFRDVAATTGDIEQIGRLMFTRYLLPFELTSFLILAAIIGAVTLARGNSKPK